MTPLDFPQFSAQTLGIRPCVYNIAINLPIIDEERAKVSSSTLAEANEQPDWLISADLAHSLFQVARSTILICPQAMVLTGNPLKMSNLEGVHAKIPSP